MAAAKSTVYVETTVIGHLVGRILADPIVAGRQLATRNWWESAFDRHRLFVSPIVLDECAAGDSDAAAERLAAIASVEFLDANDQARRLTERLLSSFAVPVTEPRDAAHISIAAVNGIQFLVTWNFKHIANPAMRRAIERTCIDAGFAPPTICTPDQLFEASSDP